MSSYFYGSFQLNSASAGLGYYLLSKDLDFPTYKPALSPIARYDGMKITGYQITERQIQVEIVVIGSSRSDCEARKDTLEAALALRDQQLNLHSEDGRYWIANAITGKCKFASGQGIVQAKVPVTFVCASPFAVAASAATPYDSGNLTYSGSSAPWASPVFGVAGGGSAYAWPHLTLTHKTANPTATTLSSALSVGTQYTSLPVASAPQLAAGQVVILTWQTGSPLYETIVQKVTTSAAVTAGATSIPVNAFTAIASFPTTTAVAASVAWNVIQIVQSTDGYTLSAQSSGDQGYVFSTVAQSSSTLLLPQQHNDTLDIYCDPSATPGSAIIATVAGVTYSLEPVGAFPPLDPTTTNFQVYLYADAKPTVDFTCNWTPRWLS